jgi:hypothetical protein
MTFDIVYCSICELQNNDVLHGLILVKELLAYRDIFLKKKNNQNYGNLGRIYS